MRWRIHALLGELLGRRVHMRRSGPKMNRAMDFARMTRDRLLIMNNRDCFAMQEKSKKILLFFKQSLIAIPKANRI